MRLFDALRPPLPPVPDALGWVYCDVKLTTTLQMKTGPDSSDEQVVSFIVHSLMRRLDQPQDLDWAIERHNRGWR